MLTGRTDLTLPLPGARAPFPALDLTLTTADPEPAYHGEDVVYDHTGPHWHEHNGSDALWDQVLLSHDHTHPFDGRDDHGGASEAGSIDGANGEYGASETDEYEEAGSRHHWVWSVVAERAAWEVRLDFLDEDGTPSNQFPVPLVPRPSPRRLPRSPPLRAILDRTVLSKTNCRRSRDEPLRPSRHLSEQTPFHHDEDEPPIYQDGDNDELERIKHALDPTEFLIRARTSRQTTHNPPWNILEDTDRDDLAELLVTSDTSEDLDECLTAFECMRLDEEALYLFTGKLPTWSPSTRRNVGWTTPCISPGSSTMNSSYAHLARLSHRRTFHAPPSYPPRNVWPLPSLSAAGPSTEADPRPTTAERYNGRGLDHGILVAHDETR
uniref:Uncharacterized protein n=1 Tax=Mycena chlorophos TaxID=658473 RepID=A0ABQ0M3R5_MYCCL|nr:predicted protein [Mycena chlorophos]